jgi:glycosyltransferase involved in cell wall biosynthesis
VAHALTVMQVLPALDAGGVERSTLEIGAALVGAGHRSLVVSAGGRLVPRLEGAGSTHVTLDVGRKSLRTLRHVRSVRALIERERPDILHLRSRLPAWIAHFALRGLRGPPPALVTTVHGLNTPGRYSAILTRGERVICVSETVRGWVLQHYPEADPDRLRVIERGIDPRAFPHGHRADARWREDFLARHPAVAGGILLTLPGRGTRLKGHAIAIRLLAALRRRGIDARLLLLGAGGTGRDGYLQELQRLANELGVADRLVVTPPRDDVRDVLSVSDLVLQLSTQAEAFGRTAAEALSLGRPVVGFDHGGIGEILARNFPEGRVAWNDEKALLATAQALLRDAPAVPVYRGATLAQMQQQTLAVYAELRRD